MKKVLVLMSSYNGEKYVEEQINSILLQAEVDITCYIRDDGSDDRTPEIIKNYAKNYKNVTIFQNENIGWAHSFFELIFLSKNKEYDYFAFSDQDDVWEKCKLINAIKILEKYDKNIPLLYFSNLKVVDSNLNWIDNRYMFNQVCITKERALVENFASGCTQVFNLKLRDLILNYRPQILYAHDYWIYLVANFLGKTIYDPNAYISYRQHSNNVIGADTGYFTLWHNRLKSFSIKYLKEKTSTHIVEFRTQELLNGFSYIMKEEDIKLIESLAFYRKNIRNKLKLLFNFEIRKSSIISDLGYRIRILFGII